MRTPLTHGLCVFVCIVLFVSSAWGYRPFVSTDAAVAERARMEIELGYFTLARTQGENTFLTPQIVVNYGFAQNLELVGEAGVEKPPDAGPQLVDPALFLKAVVKGGLLQEKEGVSAAVELGPLLPAARPEEGRSGFEGVGGCGDGLVPFPFS